MTEIEWKCISSDKDPKYVANLLFDLAWNYHRFDVEKKEEAVGEGFEEAETVRTILFKTVLPIGDVKVVRREPVFGEGNILVCFRRFRGGEYRG